MENPRVILLLSAWSAGSTAITGFLEQSGAWSCPPHWHTSDPRTPSSLEPLALRDALLSCIDEQTLRPIENRPDFGAFFSPWMQNEARHAQEHGCSHIVLKHPLQAFLLPAILPHIDPVFLIVTRPFDQIEKTRQRRQWAPVHGEQGARIIYSVIQDYLQQQSLPALHIPFERFVHDEDLQQQMLDFCQMTPTTQQLDNARAWLKPDRS